MILHRLIDFHIHCGIQHNKTYAVDAVSRNVLSSPVKKAVISSLSSIVSSEYGENDLLELSAWPEFVLTYWVNPYLKEWQQRVDCLQKRIKLAGIKLHPTANIYEPTKAFLDPLFQYCRENNLFITYHTDTFRSTPLKLTELLIDYPDVNVVLIHMDDPINSIFLAKRFPNVYLETSWIERKWETLAPVRLALDSVDNSKIFFGTDFPYGFNINNLEIEDESVRTYEDIVSFYTELLSNETAENLLYWNARRFLERYGITFED
jgi:hypothetical protein